MALVVAMWAGGIASAAAQAPGAGASAAAEKPGAADVLVGAWSRTDGGYVILIRAIGAFGQLEAAYFNPRPIAFAKAVASRDGDALRVKFELRAGGYDGSVYDLSFDRASDRLTGTFYQAVAQQKFDVVFVRKKP